MAEQHQLLNHLISQADHTTAQSDKGLINYYGIITKKGNPIEPVLLFLRSIVVDTKEYWQMYMIQGAQIVETDALEVDEFEEKLFWFFQKNGML